LEVLFQLSVLIKKRLDLVSILLQNLVSFVIECLLNVRQLVTIVLSHTIELLSHSFY
jgi:hypothetical protein